ncbi:DUF7079 family protein [Chitiniphilus eburneus]
MTPIPPVWSGFATEALVEGIARYQVRLGRSRTARWRHRGYVIWLRWYFRGEWRALKAALPPPRS